MIQAFFLAMEIEFPGNDSIVNLERIWHRPPSDTHAVPSGSGAIFEFYIPEPGVYPFVDHDKLAFLPFGLALAFATDQVPGASH
jgi:hypothetical protein